MTNAQDVSNNWVYPFLSKFMIAESAWNACEKTGSKWQ